jgi:hypothetical protein
VKIGACMIGGIGTLAIIAAFPAGAPLAALAFFSSLLAVAVAMLTVHCSWSGFRPDYGHKAETQIERHDV